MRPDFLIWTVLFLPLLAAGIITLFTRRQRQVSATLSICAVVGGFILSVIYIAWAGWTPAESSVSWLAIGEFQADFGLRLDPLSLVMLLIVTGVGSAIHIYSWGYMEQDPGFPRYFACLSLFTFSMLGIVLANNFLQLFIFWELVGLSSYLLIGFWFERPAAADAGKKAFITNRLGDFGFLLGILLVWSTLGALNFEVLRQKLQAHPEALSGMATIAGLLIFCGALGKSAQFPLHVWLPDAMEGPTPVSALIHAATMVAAGVYMLCRVFFLLELPASHALDFVALIGGVTALLAALIAIQQNDIKRILAYSTLSQLGYMVMAVGLRGPTAAMFHLTTHAFFKALLFLAAGAVILALHHQQDIWKMGALRKKLPVTFWTFLVGTLALAGIPPFSGFYSKDSILAQALEHPQAAIGYPLFLLGAGVAALTAFYMFRLLFVVFFGAAKSDDVAHAQEPAPVILWPLRVLAVFSILGGLLNIEHLYASHFQPDEAHGKLSLGQQLIAPLTHSWVAALVGLVAAAGGLFAAYRLYYAAESDPLPEKFTTLSRAMRNRFYFDEFYEATVIRFHEALARMAAGFDRVFIAGLLVRGTHGTTELLGRALRLLQTGNLQTYAFLFALGVAVVLFFALK
jgi:NADH-quinone oxidoreductase subunit L